MKNIIQPLRNNWRISEDISVDVQTQIQNRVDSEDNYTNAKGFPLIREEDISGKLGNPFKR